MFNRYVSALDSSTFVTMLGVFCLFVVQINRARHKHSFLIQVRPTFSCAKGSRDLVLLYSMTPSPSITLIIWSKNKLSHNCDENFYSNVPSHAIRWSS